MLRMRCNSDNRCHRLALTPLCFLWQRDQTELLQEMLDSSLEAVIIKVAGIGLTTDHLGKSLGHMQRILKTLVFFLSFFQALWDSIANCSIRIRRMVCTYVVKEGNMKL